MRRSLAHQLRLLANRVDTQYPVVRLSVSGEDGTIQATTSPPTPVRWGLLWSLVAMVILLLEGIAVGSKAPGDTLSESMRDVVRFDAIGRFVLLPAWSWLTFHWVLRPQHLLGISWRDFVAVGIGAAYAAWETWR